MANYPTTSLRPGQSGTEVKQLQTWLISQGYNIQAGPTGYYGEQTKAAVSQLQSALGVDPAGYPGYWGPKTLGVIKTKEETQPSQTNQTLGYIDDKGNFVPSGTQKQDPIPSAASTGTPIDSSVGSINESGDFVPTPKYVAGVLPGDTGAPTYIAGDTGGIPPVSSGAPPVDSGNVGGAGSGGGVGGAPSIDSGDTGGTGTSVTGDDTLDAILGQLTTILDNMANAGSVLNPAIELTPAEVAAFLTQAKTELSPYYNSYIDSIKTDLDADLKVLKENYDLNKEDRLAAFKSNLAIQGENEATQGTIFSGGRIERAGAIRDASQRSLQSLGLNTMAAARGAGSAAERNVGSLGLGSFSSPTIESGKLNLLGEGQYQPIETRNLYNLQGGVYGSKTRERTTAEQLRASELERTTRQSRALNFYN